MDIHGLSPRARLLGPNPSYRVWSWARFLTPLDFGEMDFSPLPSLENDTRNFMYDPGRARPGSGLLFATSHDK